LLKTRAAQPLFVCLLFISAQGMDAGQVGIIAFWE
jgi:hypothetical protein